MTDSEKEWAHILDCSGLAYEYEPGKKHVTKPDFSFVLKNGEQVHSEIKECRSNTLDSEVLSSGCRGFWGAREGRDELRPNGRVDRTGWGGHFLKAAKQLETASLRHSQTLIVFRSYSLSASLDGTDILLFMFGYNYALKNETTFTIELGSWTKDSTPRPMVAFPEFRYVSGLVYLDEDGFRIYANPLANIQLSSESYAALDRCNGVFELHFASKFHAVWKRWELGHHRLICESRI